MTLMQLAPRQTRPTRLSEAVRLEIRAELGRAGVSGVALARALGMSQPAVSDRLNGRTPWTVDETADVEYVLGLKPGSLLASAVEKCAPRDLNPEPTDSWLVGARQRFSDRSKSPNHMICGFGHLDGCTCYECRPDLYDLARGERSAYGLAA